MYKCYFVHPHSEQPSDDVVRALDTILFNTSQPNVEDVQVSLVTLYTHIQSSHKMMLYEH